MRTHAHHKTIGQKARTCRKQGVRDARGGAQCRKNVEEKEESKARDLLFATLEQPRKQKQLYSFFRQTDLCNLTGFIIVKNPDTNRLLARKFTRHIVMLQPVFHEKQIV